MVTSNSYDWARPIFHWLADF